MTDTEAVDLLERVMPELNGVLHARTIEAIRVLLDQRASMNKELRDAQNQIDCQRRQ